MRISVVSRRNATRDPRARALVASLHSAGHGVTVVCPGDPEPGLPEGVTVRTVATGRPAGWGIVGRVLRRVQPAPVRTAVATRALRRAVAATTPDLVYPVRRDDVDLAGGAVVARQPGWEAPPGDLISLAPHDLRWSRSPAGDPAPHHTPGSARTPSRPEPGRHDRVPVVVVYRVTPTSPGRYLEAALRRSGAAVTRLDGVLDWDRVPGDAAAVVIVESSYPAFEVVGANPGVPLLFWAHHGEHHLPANLRLTDRYGVDAVLLAHSWHLAHRFRVPVHRFPFAVAPELTDEPVPWDGRRHDVAMVGAGVGGSSTRYDRRRRITEELGERLPGRTRFDYGLPPAEMAAVYADSRIVVNDGGARHLPITMRVFEALGAGALLLTEDLPGTDMLLERGVHYAPMGDDVAGGVADQVERLLSPAGARIADAGHRHALDHHTYDHRVDELLAIAASTRPAVRRGTESGAVAPLDRIVDADVEVQEIAAFGWQPGPNLADRAIRDAGDGTLRPGSIGAVVIGAGGAPDLAGAVAAARGYVYAAEPFTGAVAAILAEIAPEAVVTVELGVLRADLGGIGYRMRRSDHPLAT